MVAFDFESINGIKTEFITAIGTGMKPEIGHVRIGTGIQEALHQAVIDTWEGMESHIDEGGNYDPADSHSSTGYLFVPLNSQFSEKAEYLHNTPSQGELADPLEMLPRISLYIARMEDDSGNRISAVKKINDFAGPFARNIWGTITNAELVLDTEPKFQLHKDFDFFVADDGIYVYQYKAFENACSLQKVIKESVGRNLLELEQNSIFVDYGSLLEFSSGSIRAARSIASIKANNYDQRMDAHRLKYYCKEHNVEYTEVGGRMSVQGGHLTFIRIIARQILGIELVEGEHEGFLSLNRKAL